VCRGDLRSLGLFGAAGRGKRTSDCDAARTRPNHMVAGAVSPGVAATMQYETRGRAAGAGGRGVRESAGSAGATGAWRSLRRTAHDQPKLSGQGGWNRMNAASTRYGWGGRRQQRESRVTVTRRDARAPRVRRWVRGPRGGAGNGACWGGAGRGGNSGINGGSSGKDGVITSGDHALVFSELRRVICGVAVHKTVDNRCEVRITGGILWTRCGHERNLK
jgi:hypothetical protein